MRIPHRRSGLICHFEILPYPLATISSHHFDGLDVSPGWKQFPAGLGLIKRADKLKNG
jgi:hypothetical protein